MVPVTHAVTTNSSIGVIINGRTVSFDVEPQMIDGRIFVPMRKIFEELGATVNYDDKSQEITAKRGNTTVVMQVGSQLFLQLKKLLRWTLVLSF